MEGDCYNPCSVKKLKDAGYSENPQRVRQRNAAAAAATADPRPPRYPIIFIALLAAGAYIIFAGRKD